MNYENYNRKFLKIYRPIRDVQRRYPELVAPAAAYGAVAGYNYLRNRFNQFRGSLYGKALGGAVSSLKKKGNMPPTKRKTSKPMSPPRTPKKSKVGKIVKMEDGSKYVVTGVTKGHETLVPYVEKRKAKKSKVVKTTESAMGTKIVARRKITKKSKRFSILGAEYKTEFTDRFLGNEVIYCGHATLPKKVIVRILFTCIIKKLFARVGNLTSDLSIALPLVAGTDVIRFQERGTVIAPWTNYDVPLSTCGTNVKDIIDYFTNFYHNAQLPGQFQFANISFVPTAGSVLKYTRLSLTTAKVRVKTYSNMTIQNQSKAQNDDPDSENIEAVALRGKVYQGYGNGSMLGSDSTSAINPPSYSDDKGVIQISAVTNPMQELPPGWFFTDAKKEGSFMIAPGEYKTSTLRDNFTMSWNKLFRYAVTSQQPNNNYTPTNVGKFKIVGFERVIDTFVEQGMRIAYEHQLNISAYLIPGYEQLSMPIVEN